MDRAELSVPLPSQEPWRAELGHVNGIDLYAQHSCEPTGGDLFDSVRVGSRVVFLLSDIAGKRPELDPIRAEMQRAFRQSSEEVFRAADVNLMEAIEILIQAINQAMMGASKGARFAPTMVGCYDAQLGVLAYINAGGQTALFHDSQGTRSLPNVSVPLGLFTHLTYDASIQAFEPGAMLLVVTKGVTGSMANKNPFGAERMMEVLRESKDASASAICRTVLEAAQRFGRRRKWLPFRDKPVHEDMTALALARIVQV
jgi:serine phosphatase RsbU (regulator of sigma subunit)